MRTAWPIVLSVVLWAGCGTSESSLPGEGTTGAPCEEVIRGCAARRLENEVLRGLERDGVLVAVDGLDTAGLLTFDDALERSGWLGDGRTVQVILGAADADELRWGTGTNLYFAIRWTGTCGPLDAGPGDYGAQPCDATFTTVLDARTGEFIVGGSG